MSRTRSRIDILNYIVNFSTQKTYPSGGTSCVSTEWAFHGSYSGVQQPPVGSLCMLSAAPFTKYYLSWLREVKLDDNRFGCQYLLESIEDGSLCWWQNVAIFHMPKETCDSNPRWQWDDTQWEFEDRWMRACKRRDAYITLPCTPIFNGKQVTLKTRERYGLGDYQAERTFDNWKKVKVKDMLEFYDYAVANKPKFKKS
jgi:hypothetical protein